MNKFLIKYFFLIVYFYTFLCYTQTYNKNFKYKNFDGSFVNIDLKIDSAFVKKSNQNWYEVANMGSNSSKNYKKLVKALFFKNEKPLHFVFEMFLKAMPNVYSAVGML